MQTQTRKCQCQGQRRQHWELNLRLFITVSAQDTWKTSCCYLAANDLGHLRLSLYQDGKQVRWAQEPIKMWMQMRYFPLLPQSTAPISQLTPALGFPSMHLAGRPFSRGQGNCLQLKWAELLSPGWVSGWLSQQLGSRVIQVCRHPASEDLSTGLTNEGWSPHHCTGGCSCLSCDTFRFSSPIE